MEELREILGGSPRLLEDSQSILENPRLLEIVWVDVIGHFASSFLEKLNRHAFATTWRLSILSDTQGVATDHVLDALHAVKNSLTPELFGK